MKYIVTSWSTTDNTGAGEQFKGWIKEGYVPYGVPIHTTNNWLSQAFILIEDKTDEKKIKDVRSLVMRTGL